MPLISPSTRIQFRLQLSLLLALLVFSACGYSSALSSGVVQKGPDEASPERLRLVLQNFRSDGPEPWLDRVVGDAFRREMELRQQWLVVSKPSGADWILRGRIRPLETRSVSFSSFVAALEFEVTLELDLEVVQAGGQVIRLDRRSLSENELYLASPDIEVTRTNRLEALRHLADVLASRAADTLELLDRPLLPVPEQPAG